MTRRDILYHFLSGVVFVGLLIFAIVQTRSFFREVDGLRAEQSFRTTHHTLLDDLDRAGYVAIYAGAWGSDEIQWEHVWRMDPASGAWSRVDGNAEEGR